MEEITSETSKYIHDRKEGLEKSLKVRSDRVNSTFMNGFDWNRIISIAGLSGAGKSTILRQWIREINELNKDQKFEVLSFQFEMLGTDEIARDISAKLGKPIKELYSATGRLSDEDFQAVQDIIKELKEYPINVVDNIGTVQEVVDTILYFVSSRNLKEDKKGIIVTLDHTLLVKGKDRDTEKDIIDDLMKALVALKKLLASKGVKCLFFVLSQLNRNLETTERITNPKLHYPNKNDLFGASSVYYSSDYVIIMHRPCLIEGLGNSYGPGNQKFPGGLPVFNPKNGQQPLIYLHVIKERFGQNRILAMLDDLQSSNIKDFKLS